MPQLARKVRELKWNVCSVDGQTDSFSALYSLKELQRRATKFILNNYTDDYKATANIITPDVSV